MLCKVCNTENAPGAAFCENCGAPLTEHAAAQRNAPVSAFADPGKMMCKIAVFSGIVALASAVICNTPCLAIIPFYTWFVSVFAPLALPCAIAAIVCGILGRKQSRKAGFEGKLGLYGLILGISAAVVCLLVVIITLILWIAGAVVTVATYVIMIIAYIISESQAIGPYNRF